MKIRNRLALQFTIIVATIFTLVSVSIYYFSADFRKKEFLGRLEMRALSNAKLLLDVQGVNGKLMQIFDKNLISSLSDLQIILLDDANKIVYIKSETDSTVLDDLPIDHLSKEKKVVFSYKENDGVGIIYKNKQNNNFKVLCWANDKVGNLQLNNLKIVLIFNFFICILVIAITGYFFANRSLKPISNVISQVENITASNLNLRLDTGNNKDEIAQLSATFNQMLFRLESAFRMQRSFVSNASHELRTPLTSITGQIEVALINKRSTEEYENLLKSLLDDIKTLNILSNGLLELAHLSSDPVGLKLVPVRIDDVIIESRTSLMKLNPRYFINIDYTEFPENEESLTILGNNNLLRIAFKNLLDNACKFSDNKKAEVKISIDQCNIRIFIKDSGIGIPEEEMDKIFEPFYRAKNSRIISGHGIGLSLTKKIIDLHKGNLIIRSGINIGTEIEINFRMNSSKSSNKL